MLWPVRDVQAALERVGFSRSSRSGSYILNCLTFEDYEKGELVALQDFLEVEEAPSTPHISLDEASDHGTWTWENKVLLETLTRQVLCAKGTQVSGPKLPFSCPSLCLPLPSMICTHKTPLQGHAVPQLADLLDCSLTPRRFVLVTGRGFRVLGSSCRAVGRWRPGVLTAFLIPDPVFTSSQQVDVLVLVGDICLLLL